MATVNNKTKIKEFLLDILFPRFCLGCGAEGTYLCDDCKAILEISEYKYCLCDSNPLRIPARPIGGPANQTKGKCKKCDSKKLSGLYSSLSYKEKPLTRKLIHYFKYKPYYLKDLAKPLAQLIVDHISLLGEPVDVLLKDSILIPIPVDKKKLKQRGYNQTEEIAKELAKITNTPLVSNVLIKTKKTAPQMGLAKEKRQENLKNAFACQNPEAIKAKKIFLIDDVYTTGSTMEECAITLKRVGAKEIWGIVIARD